jgi:hypothetical protein
VLSHAEQTDLWCSYKALTYIQIALYIAIGAILSIHFGVTLLPYDPMILVSISVKDGVALIVTEVEADNTPNTQAQRQWLAKDNSILVKVGDRIEIVHGVVLLTYFDGAMQQLSGPSFTIPASSSSGNTVRFSVKDWFKRIARGLNQPFQPSITAASALG